MKRPIRPCARCDKPRYLNNSYCKKHARFVAMRACARRRGKHEPSMEEMERIADGLDGMKCPDCGIVMLWKSRRFRVLATLQHYRDGSIGIVCHTCNVRHSRLPGDVYRELEAGQKFCCMCERRMPLTSFYPENRNATAKHGEASYGAYCKECHKVRMRRDRERAIRRGQVEFPKFKTCSRCHARLPVDKFGRNVASRDGRRSDCKACCALATREKRAKAKV